MIHINEKPNLLISYDNTQFILTFKIESYISYVELLIPNIMKINIFKNPYEFINLSKEISNNQITS